MKCSNLIFIFVLVSTLSLAQFKNNKWLMGTNTHFPIPWGGSKITLEDNVRNISLSSHKMWFTRNHSGLSNKTDNWFIYTNGVAVCNKNNDTIQNGGGLSPGGNYFGGWDMPIVGQSLFLPFDIGNAHYLFHQNQDACIDLNHPFYGQPISLNLYYSKINPISDNGTGEIVVKNSSVINDTLEIGNINAVRHSNGRDWWLMVKRFYSDIFYSILVTPDSVFAPITFTTNSITTAIGGQACFSPNGKIYASFSSISSHQLRLYDVNRCNGKLENYRQKFITNNLAGLVAFSPNSRFLYVGSLDSIWQFDMQSPDVFESQTLIGVYDGAVDDFGWGYIFYYMWLAPDGKIYLNANGEQNKIHVINNPDMLGISCDLQQHSIDIPTYNDQTTPTPINYDLKQEPGSPCDTLGVGLQQLKIKDLELQIFPNPSIGRFSMEYLPQTKSGMLYVYDMQGKEVYREYVSPYTSIKNLDLSAKLNNGMYALSLVFGGERETKTIVIEKSN